MPESDRCPESGPRPSIAIVGAGFSGLMCAIHLMMKSPQGGPRIHLIEKRQSFATGAAYSTGNPGHLLNTRAANMSVFVERPNHFLDWLQQQQAQFTGNGASFVSRQTYRDYLQALLRDLAFGAQAAGRLYLVADEALQLTATASDRFDLHLRMGKILLVDAAILATGNPPPHLPDIPDAAFFDTPAYIDDPWREAAFGGIAPTDPILILGTGLTMADTVLSLRQGGHVGQIVALSRRGLIPRAHVHTPLPFHQPLPPLAKSISRSLKHVRAAAAKAIRDGANWQDVIDGLRPYTADFWRGLPPEAKRRFLRHLRPWWDVHRHRLAPEIAGRIGELITQGSLVILRGQLARIEPGAVPTAVWRPTGDRTAYRLNVRHVINCTGPGGNPGRSADPLIRKLISSGLGVPDQFGLGWQVDDDARMIGRNGEPSRTLFTLGPPTRGQFWEATAVPDIRLYAERVAASALKVLAETRQLEPSI